MVGYRGVFLIFAILAVTFLAAGCLGKPPEPVPTPVPAPPPLLPPSTPPSFIVLGPEENQVFQTDDDVADVQVSLSTSDLILRPTASLNRMGEGHFIFHLDGGDPLRVFSKDYVLRNVAPGEHTLFIQLANNDNTPYNPALEKTIHFLVVPRHPPLRLYPVRVTDFAYDPAELHIHTGESVVWTNAGQSPRTVTSTDNFNSGSIPIGGNYTHTFSGPGTYDYFSVNYPSMHGKVVVER